MDRDDRGARRTVLENQITRRAFVVGSLAAGFALAVMPVAAETITTDANGLVAGEVRIPVADGEMPAYRAMPATGGPFPTILVVQEVFGVHEHIKDICRRLAKLGYFAVAPALHAREGDVSQLSSIQEILKVVAKVPDKQVASDLDAAVAWAKSTGKADTSRLGITGFCWGGRQVWLYAAHNPAVKAGVAWYGPLQAHGSDASSESPLELVNRLNAPVLGLYGGDDSSIQMAEIEQMRAALKAAGKPSEIVVYPDTPHGFNADYRDSYRPAAAKDGWKRMEAWFKQHGVG
ncbi:MAG: dienelactone hydrolase family protein [Candidatus Binatus sp.]|uniref:dienelactone hydrolase family protein n=1 Tax=Candidatus Binatus sp. TaxID=2811406 RepID=UPI002718B59B|nr:dienelactone hydrolase family protein [Candidatus Binatus sp.]MDO8431883.1 dienelactone hydrolase family protein [Candidatus Binatus sp.]